MHCQCHSSVSIASNVENQTCSEYGRCHNTIERSYQIRNNYHCSLSALSLFIIFLDNILLISCTTRCKFVHMYHRNHAKKELAITLSHVQRRIACHRVTHSIKLVFRPITCFRTRLVLSKHKALVKMPIRQICQFLFICRLKDFWHAHSRLFRIFVLSLVQILII